MSGVNLELFSKTVDQLSEQVRNRKVESVDLEKIGDDSTSFSKVLTSTIQETNELSIDADRKIHELVAGKSKDIHGTMIALEKAEISMRLMMQLRNKMVEAYQEVMRMQV